MNNIISKKFNYKNIKYNFHGLNDEHIFKQIPWYEEKLLDHIRKLNLNGVYIDVGGNIGNHSLYFLNHCKATKLFIFEPEENCYELLKKNLILNSIKKEYKLYNIAAWDYKTNLELIRYTSFNNMGISKVIENKTLNNNLNLNNIIIKANSLDNIIPNNENIVLIKIDAESSESKILKGAINIIKMNFPIIICEAAKEEEFNQINNILLPLGYKTPNQRFNATPTYIWSIR
jgi:FkbM family methyltransferase